MEENFVPLKSLNNQFGISKDAKVINFRTGKIIHSYIGVDMYEREKIQEKSSSANGRSIF